MSSPAESTDAPQRARAITFELQGDHYCVGSSRITAVLSIGDCSAVHEAPDPWYAGEITTDDGNIRVLDLSRVFASATRTLERPEGPKLIVFDVTDDEGAHYGWLVDDVGVSRQVDRQRLERTAGGMSFISGTVTLDGHEHLWLDEAAIHET